MAKTSPVKNTIKKNIPKKKLIQAIVSHLPFYLKYSGSANFLKPRITKRLGMKKERPLPAKVAMIPKIVPIEIFVYITPSASRTSIKYKTKVTE